jgi:hypothetical protein
MDMKFKILRYYLPIALMVCVALIIAGFIFPGKLDWKLNITLVASIISSIYFVEKQRPEKMEFFIKLFTECNKRYDDLNEKLNEMVQEDPQNGLSSEQMDLLYNYFNLCAEEYLFYKEGFIYPEVWKSWCNGMKVFFGNKRIKEIWQREERGGSYYGFKCP